jgi:dihydroorotate dehydrogenase
VRLVSLLYAVLFRVVFRRLDPELSHRIGFALIRVASALPGVAWLLRRAFGPGDDVLRVRVFGHDLPGPLGLAAGFDKDAVAPDALAALGFGFVEVGTVTAEAQPGNPRPRMARLPADRALVNRMGFNNHGAAAAAGRLARRSRRPGRSRPAVVGANIGRTKTVPDEAAVADYRASARVLARHCAYLVVNVSSPNTPGLRSMQAVETLRPLLGAVRAELDAASPVRVPLLVKIAPDLADQDVDAVADLALELGLDGIIATNTTTGRAGLVSSGEVVEAAGAGGLSGPVLRERSLAVLRRLHDRTGGRLVLVAAGGITDADDAWERIRAGATLLQAYTGFVYGGPAWPAQVHRGLAERVRAAGFTSLQDAVGSARV